MKIWITRSKNAQDNIDSSIYLWANKPEKREDNDVIEYGSLIPGISLREYCFFRKSVSSFKKDFGYIPKKGSCEAKNFTLTKEK